jgi:hypothetical protein
MKFLGSSLLIITLLVTLTTAPAGAQGYGYGVKGKSTFEVTNFFVSGGSDIFFQLNYRMTDTYAFVAGFETASAPGVSASGFGAGIRYYLPLAESKAEPYLFGGFVTANVAVSGLGSASGSGIQLGIGVSSRVSDRVTLGGSVGWTSIAGTSGVGYNAGLKLDLTETYYTSLGISGGGGTSAFYLGLGTRF